MNYSDNKENSVTLAMEKINILNENNGNIISKDKKKLKDDEKPKSKKFDPSIEPLLQDNPRRYVIFAINYSFCKHCLPLLQTRLRAYLFSRYKKIKNLTLAQSLPSFG